MAMVYDSFLDCADQEEEARLGFATASILSGVSKNRLICWDSGGYSFQISYSSISSSSSSSSAIPLSSVLGKWGSSSATATLMQRIQGKEFSGCGTCSVNPCSKEDFEAFVVLLVEQDVGLDATQLGALLQSCRSRSVNNDDASGNSNSGSNSEYDKNNSDGENPSVVCVGGETSMFSAAFIASQLLQQQQPPPPPPPQQQQQQHSRHQESRSLHHMDENPSFTVTAVKEAVQLHLMEKSDEEIAALYVLVIQAQYWSRN